jgi:hypothetical protein
MTSYPRAETLKLSPAGDELEEWRQHTQHTLMGILIFQ